MYTIVIDEEHDVLVYCEDMSLNGTYFNSQLIGKGKKVLLSDGDELRKFWLGLQTDILASSYHEY